MRKAQKEETRKKIKEAALFSFEKKGYGDTQIGDITKKAGVAQGTFYVHYSSKEELLDELLSEFNENFRSHLMDLWQKKKFKTLEGLVKKVARAFLDYWGENREFVKVYAEKAAQGLPLQNLRDGINPPVQQFLMAVFQSVAEHFKVKFSLELAAQGLLALWLRLGLQALFSDSFSQKDVEKILVTMTLGILKELIPNIDSYQF